MTWVAMVGRGLSTKKKIQREFGEWTNKANYRPKNKEIFTTEITENTENTEKRFNTNKANFKPITVPGVIWTRFLEGNGSSEIEV